jgi:hypothetical protein
MRPRLVVLYARDTDYSSVNYFNTTIPGSGIFLPIHRAAKRFSPTASVDSYGGSPNTPTYSTVNGTRANGTPPTPAVAPHKFSQTVGPGVRPSSPNFKPKRPSLPRPESPFRKQQPSLAPTPARQLSQSTRGARPGVTPSKNSTFKSSTSRAPSTQTPRPYSRTGSRLGNRNEAVAEEDLTPVGSAYTSNSRTTSQGSMPSFSQPLRSPSRLGSAGGQDAEVQRLKTQLQERDRRLEEQATSLAEMEQSVKELSALLPQDGDQTPGSDEGGGQSAAQLRQMLREKNEKISLLTAEFDAHRADFRSTLDSLEMASTETERVYEEQKRDLLAQLEALQDLREQKEDFEGVARQLKQLEDLVAELEEGLEESRRGEAEARGEVEFLRGEVERGRSELKRERDKAAAASANGSGVSAKELEQKDDEIRGLKAIIHRLSDGQGASGAAAAATNGAGSVNDEEAEKLRTALEDSQREKEALELELEQLRRDAAATNGHARNESERTATGSPEKPAPLGRTRSDTVKAPRAGALPDRSTTNGNGAGTVFCELCSSSTHDTLECTQLQHQRSNSSKKGSSMQEPYSPGKENEQTSNTGKGDEQAWCALCEKDGHLAFDCPEEQY